MQLFIYDTDRLVFIILFSYKGFFPEQILIADVLLERQIPQICLEL